jgi:hypothetical protein
MKASLPTHLIERIREESSAQPSPGLTVLVETILARYGKAAQAVLLYGSCMRTGQETEGIVDLYVLVDKYLQAYGNALPAVMNWLLPPNVFYIEAPFGTDVLRAKYAVLTLADLQRGTSPAWFHSYLWGRFSQPVRLLYVRSEQTAQQIYAALAQAVVTFVSRVLPQTSEWFSAVELWRKGLQLSYWAELRAERIDQATRLVDAAKRYYEEITSIAMTAIPFEVAIIRQNDAVWYRSNISCRSRLLNSLPWKTRFVQGKCLSVLRLLKGLFTFKGGLNYILWKIERHSGIGIPMDSALRRHPSVGVWVMLWRLYRRGGFR